MKTFTVNYEVLETKSGKQLTTPQKLRRFDTVADAIAEIRGFFKRDRSRYAGHLIATYRDWENGEAGYHFEQGITQRYFISQEGA